MLNMGGLILQHDIPSSVDIPAGIYDEAEFVSLIRSYISNNSTRSLVAPISFSLSPARKYKNFVRAWRYVSQMRNQGRSGAGQGVVDRYYIGLNGQRETYNGSSWVWTTSSLNETIWSCKIGDPYPEGGTNGITLILHNDIIFV